MFIDTSYHFRWGVLVTTLILIILPQGSISALSPNKDMMSDKKAPKKQFKTYDRESLSCTTDNGDGLFRKEQISYYVRNTCRKGGFLTVVGKKVLLQKSWLNESHPDGEYDFSLKMINMS